MANIRAKERAAEFEAALIALMLGPAPGSGLGSATTPGSSIGGGTSLFSGGILLPISVRDTLEYAEYTSIAFTQGRNISSVTARNRDGALVFLREGTDYYVGTDNRAYFIVSFNGKNTSSVATNFPADTYVAFYQNRISESNTALLSAGGVERSVIQANIDGYNQLIADIQQKGASGDISGVFYDRTPLDQGRTKLCWAYTEFAKEAFENGMTASSRVVQILADARAKQLAIRAKEVELGRALTPQEISSRVWNDGAFPAGASEVSTFQNNPVDFLLRELSNGPAYAYYVDRTNPTGPDGEAHLILVTGVLRAEGHQDLIMTNNSWGIQGIQTVAEFQNGLAHRGGFGNFASGHTNAVFEFRYFMTPQR